MTGDPDSRLIHRAKGGSTDALNNLFERYGERLLALVRLRLGPSLRNQLESRDVLQQTMLKAFRRIEQFDGSGERSLMAWMGAIATNEIRDQADFYRRKARDVVRNVPVEEAANEVEEQVRTEVSRIELLQKSRRLERALESLDEDQREVILLHRFEELTFEEIGKRMDRSPDACRMLHTRAMTALVIRVRELE